MCNPIKPFVAELMFSEASKIPPLLGNVWTLDSLRNTE